jgi:hypothetical protein
MRFKIKQVPLKNALNVIRASKALNKSDGEDQSLIRIKVTKENGGAVNFLASNLGVWACSSVNSAMFGDNSDHFSVEEEGEAFVDGVNFISLMATYPQDGVIEFTLKKNDNDNSSLLVASCKEAGKKGRVKTSSFHIFRHSSTSPT